MAQIAGIEVKIGGDAKELERAISQAESLLANFSRNSANAFSRVGTGISNIKVPKIPLMLDATAFNTALDAAKQSVANTAGVVNGAAGANDNFSKSTEEAAEAAKKFKQATEEASNSTEKFKQTTQKQEETTRQTTHSYNQFGSSLQNVSWQIQDFAVQMAAGTSATQALAQQAPQLLSGFGVLGTVLGTVAAVAIPLAAVFLSGADAMELLGKAMSTIGPYAAVATAALAGFYAPSILAGIASTTAAIGVGLVGAIKAVTVAMMANPLGLLIAGVAAAAVAIFAFRDDIKQVFGVDFVKTIKEAVDWSIGTMVKGAKIITVAWENIGDIVGNAVVGAVNFAIRKLADLGNVAIDVINKIIKGINLLEGYTGKKIDLIKPFEPAQFVNSYAGGAAEAGKKIAAIMAEETGTGYVDALAASASDVMSKVTESFSSIMASFGDGTEEDGKKKKADGGREPGIYREDDPFFVDRLQAIRDSFKTEREILSEEYALNQEVLDGALANKLLSEQEYYALSQKLAKEHEDALKSIRLSAISDNLGYAADFMGSMAQIAELGGKKTTKIAKAFGIAQALISTFQGAAKALTLPFPANMAAYAQVLAQGLTAVASISKVNENGGDNGAVSGGGRGGASMAGGGGGGSGGGAGPTTTFSFTLVNDPMGFGEKFARQFIDQLNSTQRNGGQIRGVIA